MRSFAFFVVTTAAVAVAAPFACGTSTTQILPEPGTDASDEGPFDGCHTGFPQTGQPCTVEGETCEGEGPGPCVPTYTCRAGRLEITSGGACDAGGGACPGPLPPKSTIAAVYGPGYWKPPSPRQPNACSPTDIAAFHANLEAAFTYDDTVKGLPASCAQCILSRRADATWQILVADVGTSVGFTNIGACYAAAPGGSAACGEAEQDERSCVSLMCSDCATAQYSACACSAQTLNACNGSFAPAVRAACGDDAGNTSKLDARCATIEDAVAVLCGTGLPDGGSLD